MNRIIPTINTARLTLRAMRPTDFDRFAEIWASDEVTAHINGPLSRDAAWGSFLRNAGHWQITGFGQWGIEVHQSKRLVGQVGFFYGARGYGPEFDAVPEAGWVLSPDAQGLGYAREATAAAHDWFDRVIKGALVCQIAAAHENSLRLAERLGYVALTTREEGALRLLSRRHPPGETMR